MLDNLGEQEVRSRERRHRKPNQREKRKEKYRTPNAPRQLPLATPLSQRDSCQLDQVSHARGDDDGLLVRVAGLVVALHLLHHKLGVAQQRVLGEAVEVEASGGHRGLRAQMVDLHEQHANRDPRLTGRPRRSRTSILLRRSS